MATLPADLITSASRITVLETTTNVSPDLVSVYSIPFPLEEVIYFWLWDNSDFILWDNGDRMRQ